MKQNVYKTVFIQNNRHSTCSIFTNRVLFSIFQPESCISKYSDPHAYCVVYSSADRSSLACAERILQNLWTSDNISTRAVILVANKADLVRSRVVPTEGKSNIFFILLIVTESLNTLVRLIFIASYLSKK